MKHSECVVFSCLSSLLVKKKAFRTVSLPQVQHRILFEKIPKLSYQTCNENFVFMSFFKDQSQGRRQPKKTGVDKKKEHFPDHALQRPSDSWETWERMIKCQFRPGSTRTCTYGDSSLAYKIVVL